MIIVHIYFCLHFKRFQGKLLAVIIYTLVIDYLLQLKIFSYGILMRVLKDSVLAVLLNSRLHVESLSF